MWHAPERMTYTDFQWFALSAKRFTAGRIGGRGGETRFVAAFNFGLLVAAASASISLGHSLTHFYFTTQISKQTIEAKSKEQATVLTIMSFSKNSYNSIYKLSPQLHNYKATQ